MQQSILQYLRCPVSQEPLELKIYEENERSYNDETVKEITAGLLSSPNGFIYPIVNGVPRMQMESFLEFGDFIKKHHDNYKDVKSDLQKRFGFIIKQGVKKHRKVKQSFGMEWSIFDYDKDKTWIFGRDERKERFLKEINANTEDLKGKFSIDVGCGNGVLTSAISEFGLISFGIDVSDSIERAYENNTQLNVHYIQADLQNLPFQTQFFDLIYSSGVIHHTNNTELSFSCIAEFIKPAGKLYVWLYHPIDNLKHHALNRLRSFTNKLPLKIQYLLYLIFLVPQALVKARLKGIKRNWREQLINFFDVLSPEFRFEHTIEEVETWYLKREFTKPEVTINEYYGFGLHGTKRTKN
ncbi:MAG: hypothetical protein COC01_09970 [Bacteroidetes bacterium]|nr:class I SAM-dependent methyltransferase [Bacteroidia bacterium]PCH65298.1 MAG: hypothetical protein COC01_09970 [Bacteroidota bacterium]